jgi:hypothetical protein
VPARARHNVANGPALQTERPSRSSGRARAVDPETALRPLSEVLAERAERRKRWMPPAYGVDSDMRTYSITGSGDKGGSRIEV